MSLKKSTANTRETRVKAISSHVTLTPEIASFIDEAAQDVKPTAFIKPAPPVLASAKLHSTERDITPAPKKGGRIEKNAIKDGFSLPKETYAVINEFIKEGMGMNTQLSKSDVVRFGLELLKGLSPSQRRKLIESDQSLKRF